MPLAGNDEVAAVFAIRSEAELQAYTSETLSPARVAENKTRTLGSCRSLSTASLTELSLSKGVRTGRRCPTDVLAREPQSRCAS